MLNKYLCRLWTYQITGLKTNVHVYDDVLGFIFHLCAISLWFVLCNKRYVNPFQPTQAWLKVSVWTFIQSECSSLSQQVWQLITYISYWILRKRTIFYISIVKNIVDGFLIPNLLSPLHDITMTNKFVLSEICSRRWDS